MQKREKIRKLNKKCANEAKYAKNKQITQNLGKLRKIWANYANFTHKFLHAFVHPKPQW
jgi:hypothetical protein